MPDACDIMAREGKGLKEAITDLSIPLTTNECATIMRRKSFQALLRQAKIRFRAEVAGDPGRSKQSTIGQLQILADKLEAEGSSDKAAAVLLVIAKLENWVGEGGQVNVFQGVTQKDIDEMKAKIARDLESRTAGDSTQPLQPN
jgi:hypothetical protein